MRIDDEIGMAWWNAQEGRARDRDTTRVARRMRLFKTRCSEFFSVPASETRNGLQGVSICSLINCEKGLDCLTQQMKFSPNWPFPDSERDQRSWSNELVKAGAPTADHHALQNDRVTANAWFGAMTITAYPE